MKKKTKNKKNVNSEIEVGNLFKIILVIMIVFGIFYILTYYMQKNKKTTTNNGNNDHLAIIQYDEILIGNMLNQSEEEYYVLILNEEDYRTKYKNYLANYTNINKFYYALIDNAFNKPYIGETSNLNVDNLSDLKISDTSLLKISAGKIVETYDGNSAVMQKFIDINK